MKHLPPLRLKHSVLKYKSNGTDYDENKAPPVKNYGITISYYSKNINKDKNNKEYLIKRAICYFAKGYYQYSLKDALRTIELDPHFTKGYYYVALSYLEMYDIDNAEKYSKDRVSRVTYGINKTKMEIKNKCEKYFLYNNYIFFGRELYRNNAFFPKLEIKFYSDDNRGVCAKSYIQKNEIIMSIPLPCLISLEVALATKIGSEIGKIMYKELQSPKHCGLSAFLGTEERNQKWKFYFDGLPKDFSNFPIFYTDEELMYLEGSPFLAQILEKRRDIQNDYAKICKHIPLFKQFTYLQFSQARMLISSRIFGITINNVNTDVLAPFADLLNHKRPRQTQWYYDDSNGSFIIQAIENIPENSEIFDSYGQKTNSRFLGNYGFALEDNDSNEYTYMISLNDSFPGYELKKQFFRGEHEYLQAFTGNNNLRESHGMELLSYLRFLLFDGNIEEGYNVFSKNNMNKDIMSSVYYTPQISKDLELRVGIYFRSSLLELLKDYPTTREEDILKGREKSINFNKKNCLLLLISEKYVLNYFLEFCDYCIEGLEMNSEGEIMEKLTHDYRNKEIQYDFYIQDIITKLVQDEESD